MTHPSRDEARARGARAQRRRAAAGRRSEDPAPGAVGSPAGPAAGVRPRDLLLLATLALLLRLLYLLSIRGEPFFGTPTVDSRIFWEQALALAGGGGGEPVHFKPPLLTWMLAGWITLFGDDFGAARLGLAIISAAAAPLTAVLAGPILGRRGAVLAGGLVAVYAPAVFLGPEVLPASPVLVLNLLLLICLARAEERPGRLSTGLGGLLLGVSALARPTILLLAPLIWWRWRRHPARTGILAAGIVLVVLPVLVHNAGNGSPVPISSNGGLNFYLGNNAGSDGRSAFAPELSDIAAEAREASVAVAEGAEGRTLSDAEVSRYWYRQGLSWLGHHPGEAVALWGRKLYYLLNDREIADNVDFYAVAELSPPLRLLPLRFGLLLALAVPGLTVLWRRPRGRLLLCYGLAVLLPPLVFFVVARFRLPLLPLLAIAAVAGGTRLYDGLRRGPRAWSLLLPVALALVVGHSRLLDVAEDQSWHYHRNSGDILYRQGKLAEAARAYEESLRRNDRIPSARNALAFIYAERGERLARAEELVRGAIRLKPEHRRYYLDSLGWVLFRQGRLAEAAASLEEAISLMDDGEAGSLAEARFHLARVRRAQGDSLAADRLFRAAAAHYPRAAAEIASPGTGQGD